MHLYLKNKSWIPHLTLSFNVWNIRLSHIWPLSVIMLKPPVCISRGTGAFVSYQYVSDIKFVYSFSNFWKNIFQQFSISALHFFHFMKKHVSSSTFGGIIFLFHGVNPEYTKVVYHCAFKLFFLKLYPDLWELWQFCKFLFSVVRLFTKSNL